jgi:GrpE
MEDAVNAVNLIGPLVGLAMGGVGGWLLARRQSRQPPVPLPLSSAPDAGADRELLSDAREDRKRLIGACIDVGDRLRTVSPALWQKLERALADAGIEPVEADGEPFDPDRHDAVGSEPTTDPAQDLRVVTDLPGYTDHGAPLRRPQVVVHRFAGGAA